MYKWLNRRVNRIISKILDFKQNIDFPQYIYISALKFTIYDMINEIKRVMAVSESKKI